MKTLLISLSLLFLSACASSPYPNQQPLGEAFPSVLGTSLEEQAVNIPQDLGTDPKLLLIGYKQDSQFDIDRWLIGLDMTQTNVVAYELPTIKGLAPRMFKNQINQGMRNGIPEFMWSGVITIYKDGDQLQRFTGNERPNNARVILLDGQNTIVYFYDRGFSVKALNELRDRLAALGNDQN